MASHKNSHLVRKLIERGFGQDTEVSVFPDEDKIRCSVTILTNSVNCYDLIDGIQRVFCVGQRSISIAWGERVMNSGRMCLDITVSDVFVGYTT